MSRVTNAILSFSIIEEHDDDDTYPVMDTVNAWLHRNANGQRFGPDLGSINEAVGGRKALETPLFVAAFNHFPEEAFLQFLGDLPWQFPGDVQLILKRQEDDRFEILTIESERKG